MKCHATGAKPTQIIENGQNGPKTSNVFESPDKETTVSLCGDPDGDVKAPVDFVARWYAGDRLKKGSFPTVTLFVSPFVRLMGVVAAATPFAKSKYSMITGNRLTHSALPNSAVMRRPVSSIPTWSAQGTMPSRLLATARIALPS